MGRYWGGIINGYKIHNQIKSENVFTANANILRTYKINGTFPPSYLALLI